MAGLIETLSSSMIFGFVLTLAVYKIVEFLYIKTNKCIVFTPAICTIFVIVGILYVLDVSYANYYYGAAIFEVALTPTTAALALPIYRQRKLIKENFLPIMAGSAVGAISCIHIVKLLCILCGYDRTLTLSMLAKSVTTPIAIESTNMIGGESSIVILSVIITGQLGSICLPGLIKYLHLKNPVSIGISCGTSAHAMGTAKALEIGEDVGAMSGIAIGIAGIWTILYFMFFPV